MAGKVERGCGDVTGPGSVMWDRSKYPAACMQ